MSIKSTTEVWGVGMGEKKKKKIQKNPQNKSKRKNNKCFSWVTVVTVHLTSLGCPPTLFWSLDLLWGQLRFYSGPTPLYSCFQRPQLSELVHLLLWELSTPFYTYHRHRVCLDDRVDLTCSLSSWWEGFGSSSLATLPLGFNCGFISTSAHGSSTGVCSWGCPGGLGFAPVRARCGGRCSCLGRRGSGSTRYSGVLAARAAGNTVL